MRFLIDTHTLLYWLDGDKRLPMGARKIIGDEDNEVIVSAATAWEIATKVRIGKLPGATEVASRLPAILASQGFESLPISVPHAMRAGMLPGPHRDPFDRMLIAQAQAENIPIISNDRAFDSYRVQRMWQCK
jgi:PIN domain nuclease of toxin-antitoxin system